MAVTPTGSEESYGLPLPSCREPFEPQQRTVPSAKAAQLVTDTTKAADEAKKKADAAIAAAKTAQSALQPAAKALTDATANLTKAERTVAAMPPVKDPVGGDLDDAKREHAAAKQATIDAEKALATAKAGLPAAEQLVQTTKDAIEAAKQQVEANAGLNPIEKAPPPSVVAVGSPTVYVPLLSVSS